MFNRALNGKKISERKEFKSNPSQLDSGRKKASRMEAPLAKYEVTNHLHDHQEASVPSKTAA